MRRRLPIIAICVLLGAVVNVAVAWGCAAWIQVGNGELRFARLSDGKLWRFVQYDGLGASRLQSFQDLDALAEAFPEAFPEGLPKAGMVPPWSRLSRKQSSERLMEDARGWPSLAMSCELKWYYRIVPWQWKTTAHDGGIALRPKTSWRGTHKYRALPYRPIWPGFAFNTLFYAALLWLLIPGPFALRRFLRLRRGLCPRCAYPMGESAVCTECGGELPERVRTP